MLKLRARGRGNNQIGSDLFISEPTVKTYVQTIFAKLNVLSRSEAIKICSVSVEPRGSVPIL